MFKTARRFLATTTVFGSLLLAPVAFADQAQRLEVVPSSVLESHAGSQGPAMWVIRDEDSTIYLYGSFHFLKPETQWQQAHVDAAFASADEVWFEATDIDDVDQAQFLIQQHGMSPGRPLSSHLSAEDNERLQALLVRLQLPPAALESSRPWLANMNLAVVQLIAAGYRPDSGVDKVLMLRAREQGKPMKGLESLAEQIMIFSSISDEAQVEALRDSLSETDEVTTVLSELLTAWSTGDMDSLGSEMVDSLKEKQPEIYDALFTRRNANWTQQIKTILAGEGTSFIVVGAAHLAGENSVQSMLAEEGITSERVTH